MKKLLAIGLALLGIVLAGCSPSVSSYVNDGVGPQLINSKGDTFSFASYHGKWVLVNYWASWCHVCASEMPILNAFQQRHAPHHAVVVGYNLDGLAEARLGKLLEEWKINFPTLVVNPSQQLGVKSIRAVPLTVLINPEGKIVKQWVGGVSLATLEEATGSP